MDEPCAKCSALICLSPGTYGASMSRNSARSLMALSERISIDFMREITKVTRNCPSTSEWGEDNVRDNVPLRRHLARRVAHDAKRRSFD